MPSYSISFGERENLEVVKRADARQQTVAEYIRALVRADMEEKQ